MKKSVLAVGVLAMALIALLASYSRAQLNFSPGMSATYSGGLLHLSLSRHAQRWGAKPRCSSKSLTPKNVS